MINTIENAINERGDADEITEVSTSEEDVLKAVKSCDPWISLKKFANRDIARVGRILYSDGPQTLGELRDKTGIETNKLNHHLIEMKRVELVKKIGKKYYLTKYAALLLDGWDLVKKRLAVEPEDQLLTVLPYGVPKEDIEGRLTVGTDKT